MIAGIHCILRDRSRCDICRQRVVRCGRLVVSYNKLAASGGEINDLQVCNSHSSAVKSKEFRKLSTWSQLHSSHLVKNHRPGTARSLIQLQNNSLRYSNRYDLRHKKKVGATMTLQVAYFVENVRILIVEPKHVHKACWLRLRT